MFKKRCESSYEFSTFVIKSLQNNMYNAIGKLKLMKIQTIILIVNSY